MEDDDQEGHHVVVDADEEKAAKLVQCEHPPLQRARLGIAPCLVQVGARHKSGEPHIVKDLF